MQFPAATVLFVVILAAAATGAAGMSLYHTRQVDRLHAMVETDPLTGLGNRRGWNLLQAAPCPRGEQAAVILLDLDQFKPINDRYGHDIGDRVLQEFAYRLVQATGPDGRGFRLGGDEFVAVFRLGKAGTTDAAAAALDRAAALYDRVVGPWTVPADVDDTGWDTDVRTIEVRSSVGVTSGDPHHLRDLLRAADRAMYAAKRGGGGVHYIPCVAATSAETRPAVRLRDRRPKLATARHRAAG